jgi:G3E family GTPase
MSAGQVPVTIVSGEDREMIARAARRVCEALGGRRIAVVGFQLPDGPWGFSVDLDVHIIYRTPGCLCCAYRADLVDVLSELPVGAGHPEWIIVIEAPGADPLLAIQTLLADPTVRRRVLLDGLVVSVDAPQLATRLSSAHGLRAVSTGSGPIIATWSSTIVLDGLNPAHPARQEHGHSGTP